MNADADAGAAQTARATWRTSRRTLSIGQRPLVMGILNVTPDSFSDGGRHTTNQSTVVVQSATEAALQMVDAGVDIIDVGGESTRPYSEAVDAETEASRVVPVIEAIATQSTIPISIDTSKASVARKAVEAGAEIINDVTGLEGDDAMPTLAAESRAGVCVMHMRGTPQTMQDDLHYDDVVGEIERYLQDRYQFCLSQGLNPEAICLDPGIGFGKSHEQNVALLNATKRFMRLPCPILVGHSRKGFIQKQIRRDDGVAPSSLMAATLGVSLAVAAAGAHVIRVHDVAETVDGLKLFELSGGLSPELEPSIELPRGISR
ncbi:MAG: dihydropteroate synthase [Planctomycetota bacterium]